jgi:hypothetical protein
VRLRAAAGRRGPGSSVDRVGCDRVRSAGRRRAPSTDLRRAPTRAGEHGPAIRLAVGGRAAAIDQRARVELISIVTATSVYAPVAVALDVFVEDSHLVRLFVRRSARCGRGKARAGVDPPRTASRDRLDCWTAEPSKQVRVLAESPKASLLQADHLISRAAAFA